MRDNAAITPDSIDSNIFDDLFHGCAFQAYLDEARAVQGWPNPEATRRRAYRYYEEALAGKHRGSRTPHSPGRQRPDAKPPMVRHQSANATEGLIPLDGRITLRVASENKD